MSSKRQKVEALFIYLPDDIVQEILVKLPVKSLLRFKCVCKSWLSLISTHKFALAHLNQTGKSSLTRGVIESRNLPCPHHVFCSILRTGQAEAVKVGLPTSCTPNRYTVTTEADILGSCNGMLLLGIGNRMKLVLWNPTTRVSKVIPPPNFEYVRQMHNYVAGLGYSSDIDNYKVVVAVHRRNGSSVLACVYNLKTNSWKQLETSEFPYVFSWDEPGTTLVNGAPHWVMQRQCGTSAGGRYHILRETIVYFDMVEEKFKELPPPPLQRRTSRISLGCVGGSLCASRLIIVNGETKVEILNMKEYGVKESWCKLVTFPFDQLRFGTFEHMMPLDVLKKGELLMEINRKSIAVYKAQTKEFEEVLFSGYGHGFRAVSYHRSLVSPNGL